MTGRKRRRWRRMQFAFCLMSLSLTPVLVLNGALKTGTVGVLVWGFASSYVVWQVCTRW